MSDTVLVAIINGVFLVIVAVTTQRMRKDVAGIKKDAAAARHQVENEHKTNFRDDHDELRRSVEDRLDDLGRRQDRFAREVKSALRRMSRRLDRHIDDQGDT